jgi:hypothetical protein
MARIHWPQLRFLRRSAIYKVKGKEMTFFWKHLHGNTYDVWMGNGWDNWSRIRVNRDNSYTVGGFRLPNNVMKDVVNSING